jgi:hypothetical protein
LPIPYGGGFALAMRFPTVKLLDYRRRWPALEASPNPFATVVMAHLQARATRRRPRERLAWKERLTFRLYDRGFGRQDILDLYLFIDWLLALPEELEAEFQSTLQRWEEERRMPYITSIERTGIEKGRKEGVLLATQQAVLDALAAKFGAVPESVTAAIAGLSDVERLRALHGAAVVAGSLAEFEAALQARDMADASGQ